MELQKDMTMITKFEECYEDSDGTELIGKKHARARGVQQLLYEGDDITVIVSDFAVDKGKIPRMVWDYIGNALGERLRGGREPEREGKLSRRPVEGKAKTTRPKKKGSSRR
jgi:hypothetical protein